MKCENIVAELADIQNIVDTTRLTTSTLVRHLADNEMIWRSRENNAEVKKAVVGPIVSLPSPPSAYLRYPISWAHFV